MSGARVEAKAATPDEDGVYARVPAGGTATGSAVVAVQAATAGVNANAVKANSRNADAPVVRAQGPGTLLAAYDTNGTLVFEVDQSGISVGGSGTTPSSTVAAETSYGQVSAAGSSDNFSRGDHTHGTPSLTSSAAASSAPGDAAAAGVATTPARADHVHGREAFGTTAGSVAQGNDS